MLTSTSLTLSLSLRPGRGQTLTDDPGRDTAARSSVVKTTSESCRVFALAPAAGRGRGAGSHAHLDFPHPFPLPAARERANTHRGPGARYGCSILRREDDKRVLPSVRPLPVSSDRNF